MRTPRTESKRKATRASRTLRATPQRAAEPSRRRGWQAGDPCGACGSTDTYGYDGSAGCNACHAHDQDGG